MMLSYRNLSSLCCYVVNDRLDRSCNDAASHVASFGHLLLWKMGIIDSYKVNFTHNLGTISRE
jgi:hypothetical protein